jgi:hypothetical protein
MILYSLINLKKNKFNQIILYLFYFLEPYLANQISKV